VPVKGGMKPPFLVLASECSAASGTIILRYIWVGGVDSWSNEIFLALGGHGGARPHVEEEADGRQT
jgi:hypothetical protein